MDGKELPKKLATGTTTMALICSDGVVVGADTRATAGSFIAHTEARKVFKIDNNLAMTIAGGVGDAQELIRIIKAQNEVYKMNEGRPLSPRSAASLMAIILQQNKGFPFYVELIVTGLDGDVPQLFDLDPFGGSAEQSRFTASGSGSYVALGYLEDMYKKGITTKEAVRGVARALQLAMKRDSATGNGMTIATITKAGYTEYNEKDLEKILAAK
ncbi:MAG: proteasome subunit beta [Candidatus Micrarchaeota archaeon]|nr:proteasome subunit beta [Candidatus Micrarchaeota archaeon]